MSSNTWNVEIFVPEKGHYGTVTEAKSTDWVVDRAAAKIHTETGVYPKPTRAQLIDEHWDALQAAGITPGTVEEVEVSINPFCP